LAFVRSPSPRILSPSLCRLITPASSSVSAVIVPDASRPSRRPTFTTAYSTRKWFVKPRFGTRRWMGICPPSNPMKFMLPVRAFWPLPPRPAVLPSPLACPRPTLFFSFTPPPRGGVSLLSSFITSSWRETLPGKLARSALLAPTLGSCHSRYGTRCRRPSLLAARLALALGARPPPELLELLLGLLDLEEIADLLHHPAYGGSVLDDAHAPDPGEREASHGREVTFRMSAHPADELDSKGHGSRSLLFDRCSAPSGAARPPLVLLPQLGEVLAAEPRHVFGPAQLAQA